MDVLKLCQNSLKNQYLWCFVRYIHRLVLILCCLLLVACQRKTVQEEWQPVTPIEERPLIIIDAGHGGADKGAVNRKQHVYEKKLCFSTAAFLKERLEKLGYKTLLIRPKDTFVELDERVKIANRQPSSLFVSLHFNSAPNAHAEGIEVYYFNDPEHPIIRHDLSKALAQSIVIQACKSTGATSRGARVGSYRVIRNTKMPACLVEGGFVTNRAEAKKLLQSHYLQKLADGIAKGIDQYCVRSKFTKEPAKTKKP